MKPERRLKVSELGVRFKAEPGKRGWKFAKARRPGAPPIKAALKPDLGEYYLSSNDVCRKLGIGRSTLYKMVSEGRFPKPNKVISHAIPRWPVSLVDEFMLGKWVPEKK